LFDPNEKAKVWQVPHSKGFGVLHSTSGERTIAMATFPENPAEIRSFFSMISTRRAEGGC
jgi:hypothetical protein